MDKESLDQALALAQERITSLESTLTRLNCKQIRMLEALSAAQPAARHALKNYIGLEKGSRTHPRFLGFINPTVPDYNRLDNSIVASEIGSILESEGWV